MVYAPFKEFLKKLGNENFVLRSDFCVLIIFSAKSFFHLSSKKITSSFFKAVDFLGIYQQNHFSLSLSSKFPAEGVHPKMYAFLTLNQFINIDRNKKNSVGRIKCESLKDKHIFVFFMSANCKRSRKLCCKTQFLAL